MIAGHISAPAALGTRLQQMKSSLASATNTAEALDIVNQVPVGIGLTRGGRAWARSTAILRSLLGPRLCRASAFPPGGFDYLREQLTDEEVSLLTYNDADDPANVQVMGLYQSKGREADATVVLLRGNDFYGNEAEPMSVGSRLLYVVLTRARRKTIVLTLGSTLRPLVDPLAALSSISVE